MRTHRPLLRTSILAVGALLAASAGRTQGDVCRIEGVPRVVAVGDVHGADATFREVLQLAGVVDAKGRWTGGKAHLVQTGDLIDRGAGTREVLDLLMRLERDARKAGGRVHVLLGNHEAMNLMGDLRYVSATDYESFRGPRSEELRQALYDAERDRARRQAEGAGQPFDEAAHRARFLAETPLGFVERVTEFGARGRYGRWLRERPTSVRVNGVAFVHGGMTPEVAARGCEALNASVRRELNEDFEKTRAATAGSLSAGENGPLWYRGLAREDETTFAPSLDAVLGSLGARAIVIGHTVTGTGRIQPRFGGRVVMIDVGMQEGYGGHRAALEIGADGTMTALYPDRREPLPQPAAAPAAARSLAPASAPGGAGLVPAPMLGWAASR